MCVCIINMGETGGWDLGCSCPNSSKHVSFKYRCLKRIVNKEANSRMSEGAQVPEVELVLNMSSFTSVILFPQLKLSNATCRQFPWNRYPA